MSLDWSDIEEIAERLADTHLEVNPLTIRFTDLLRWIVELEDFDGDPKSSDEKKLEAVQMAWYEEWKARDSR
ncbi:MAG TPA: Fe-S cluster assembly protein IscX [bacterium]|nr:Fe-S cluster assembly protein IscX [bacterium]HPO07191.1 Fe-S cluster assembly protein IscX [bacterium]HQO34825.1 Fe-S cluster assembly protein IscX [bacterium]HQP98785.1 Fe-S cluster assembly protein IscX [bacterium]